MELRLTANVGVFTVEGKFTTHNEADDFIQWVYALEGGEERQAIKQADSKADDIPFDDTPSVTVEDAINAVKAYAAVHKPDKARELMSKFGFSRTNEITQDAAASIVAACQEAM